VVVERKAHVAGPQTNSPRSLYTSHHHASSRIITHHHGSLSLPCLSRLSVYSFRCLPIIATDLFSSRRSFASSCHSLRFRARFRQMTDFGRNPFSPFHLFLRLVRSSNRVDCEDREDPSGYRILGEAARDYHDASYHRLTALGIALRVSFPSREKALGRETLISHFMPHSRACLSRSSPLSSSARQADRHLSPSCCLRLVAELNTESILPVCSRLV